MSWERMGRVAQHYLDDPPERDLNLIAAVVVLAPADDGVRLTVDDVRALVSSRLHQLPRLRRRLASTPFGLASPLLVDDPDFDIARHVIGAPGEPVGDDGLRRAVADQLATPLDRGAPLWRMLVVDLDDGGTAIVYQVHHFILDGVLGMQSIETLLLDLTAEAERPSAVRWRGGAPPSAATRAVLGLAARAQAVGAALGAAGRFAVDADRRAARLRLLRAVPRAVSDQLVPRGQPRAFNVPVSPSRVVAFGSLPLDDARAAVAEHGGDEATVNDLVLALVGAGISAWAEANADDGDPSFHMMEPVSMVLRYGEAGRFDRRDGYMIIEAALGRCPLPERLAHTTAQTRQRKGPEGAAFSAVLDAVELLPRRLRRVVRRSIATTRHFNLVVSNVRGPSVPVWVLGRAVRAVVPLSSLPDDHGLRIVVASTAGWLWFGVLADDRSVPGHHHVIAGIVDAAREVGLHRATADLAAG